ncbi:MAG: tol-pal system protein YbgF [Rhodobacteraceae bacterium]|nr:tol-pal system protein YbgF [Paracoccaceae bacterium]
MIRSILAPLAVAAALAAPAATFGQDRAQTVADMRAELSSLAAELQSLRAELISGGATALTAAGGASALDRMNAMENALSQITSRTEALQNRIDRIVADGTNRIGDLEFRICELEDGCDPANLPITASLGGAAGATAPAGPDVGGSVAATAPGPELAVSEKADFDRAKATLDAGDFVGAAAQFQAFITNYPGGPLSGDAEYLRGDALQQAGDISNAARAYLNAFSGAPNGPRAPSALLKLGAALGLLQQTQDACVTLGQVGARFPTAPEAVEATTAMRALGCS